MLVAVTKVSGQYLFAYLSGAKRVFTFPIGIEAV
jgi:hypothetical protein